VQPPHKATLSAPAHPYHEHMSTAGAHPVTITVDAERPGPAVPDDFAGLSFERGPLNPGNAGVEGHLFSPANLSLVTLFRELGLRNLRIGGGSVDEFVPAGLGSTTCSASPPPRGRG